VSSTKKASAPSVTNGSRGTRSADGAEGEIAQTLDRGLRALEFVAASPEGVTIHEVATELGINRTIVYRLLTTLQIHQLIRRAPDARYRLGTGVLEMARMIVPRLRQTALPELRALANSVQATAHLTVADGDEAVAVAVIEPDSTDFHVAYRVGSRHPLNRGAAGVAILAARPSARGDTAAVKKARADGFAMTAGHLQAGAFGVAAAIRTEGCSEEASIGVAAFTEEVVSKAAPAVVASAQRVAHSLCALDAPPT
jgi:DNA-binding IclR family transcriptional regulator